MDVPPVDVELVLVDKDVALEDDDEVELRAVQLLLIVGEVLEVVLEAGMF